MGVVRRSSRNNHHPEKDGADGHKRAGDAVQVVRGVLAVGFRLRKSQVVACGGVRVQVRAAAPWIARRETHEGGEKGGEKRGEGDEKGGVEGKHRHRQPAAASPTPFAVPRDTSRSSTSKRGGEGGEGGGGRGGGGVERGVEYRWQGRLQKRTRRVRPPPQASPRRRPRGRRGSSGRRRCFEGAGAPRGRTERERRHEGRRSRRGRRSCAEPRRA